MTFDDLQVSDLAWIRAIAGLTQAQMTFDDLQVSDLAWIRAIAGLTQAQAAERLGISKSHYAGIEAGSYTGDKVILNVGKLLNEDQINRAISVLQFIRFIKNI